MRSLLSTRTRLLAIVGAAIGLGLIGFAAVYLTMFNPRSVAAVALPAPGAVVTAPSSSATAGAAGATWRVAAGSFVGYRVREQLAMLPAPSDAVGRTAAVTGSATVLSNADGSATVSAISVSADLTQLQSDSARRDGYLGRNSLESSRYPTATLVGSSSFMLPASVVNGSAGDVQLSAKLTIHGVTRDVTIRLKVQRSGAGANVVGTYQFHWGDFGVSQPSVPVASVQGDPRIEISLVLSPA